MRRVLIVLLVIAFSLAMASPATPATTTYDYFDNWTGIQVADNWTSYDSGTTGGEFNQIYEAGQDISCGGDGTNYKSVTREFSAKVPYHYLATVEAISNSTNKNGVVDGTYVEMLMTFEDANHTVLKNSYTNGAGLSGSVWKTMQVSGYAPDNTNHVKIFLKVLGGTSGGTVFKNFKIYEAPYSNSTDQTLLAHSVLRNTEWTSGATVASGWTAESSGGGSGQYKIRATGGSAQGISAKGDGTTYKQISRTFTAEAGFNYSADIEVVSNVTNKDGTVDASYIRVYMEFLNSSDTVLATHSAPGNQFSVKPADTTRMQVQAVSPLNTAKARITVRVYGGTGGGAVFDTFSLMKY